MARNRTRLGTSLEERLLRFVEEPRAAADRAKPGREQDVLIENAPGAVQDAKKDEMKKGTTGSGKAGKNMGSSSAPSSSGNVGPGTNNNNGPQPGGR